MFLRRFLRCWQQRQAQPCLYKTQVWLTSTADFIFVKPDLFPDVAVKCFGKNTGKIYVSNFDCCCVNEYHFIKFTHPNSLLVLNKLRALDLQHVGLTKTVICNAYNSL